MTFRPWQILSYYAQLRGYPRKDTKKRVEDVVEMVGLSEWIDKKIATFSKGMRQKIGIVSSIVHDPQVVVLDEPTTGLDPKARIEIRSFILKLKEMGKTIFISSHQLYEISEIADRVAILNFGELIAFDTLDNLEARVKKSIIHVEIYPHPNGQDQEISKQLEELLSPFTGLDPGANKIVYNKNNEEFEILFDGDPTHQIQIFKALADNDYGVLEFTVPRAGLLEDLYLSLVKEGGKEQ